MEVQILTCATNYTAVFGLLMEEGLFADCTLAAEGRHLKAHRAVLSAASVFFELLFTQEQERDPVIIFTNIRYKELEAVMKFIYHGEVEIFEDELEELLNAVSFLQIGGLDHNKLILRQRNAPTCDSEDSLMTFERSSIQEESSVSVKVEGEETISDDKIADSQHINHYMSWEESSQIMSAICYDSVTAPMLPCDENVLKTEIPDSDCSLTHFTGQPTFGYELSSLVTDIVIKEPDDEICSDVKIETADATRRMEDGCTVEDLCGISGREASPGHHDASAEEGEVDVEEAKVELSSESVDVEAAGAPSLACVECGKVFGDASQLSVHAHTHTGERPFVCEVCGKDFQKKGHLKVHLRTHTGERPYACEVCGKAFNQTMDLTRHMRTHTGERPFVCEVCGKDFKTKGDLKVHLRTHTGERPYACEVCGKTFCQAGSFARHQRTHTGERPNACEVCGKTFKEKGSLTLHLRTHTGERPYACEVCGKAFNQAGDLTRHFRKHTGERPFVCNMCGKDFQTKGDLKVHLRIHTGERPYACKVCGKAFSEKGSLTRHMRMHTGERPFACEVCGKAFRHANSLAYHHRTHARLSPTTPVSSGNSPQHGTG